MYLLKRDAEEWTADLIRKVQLEKHSLRDGATHIHFDLYLKPMADQYTRQWIIENTLQIIQRYAYGELTLRALHYQLVGLGMTNTQQHYKRVVAAMEVARWDGLVDFEVFSDHKRAMIGETDADSTDLKSSIQKGKDQIRAWMQDYFKNRWENQPIYAEMFIEKQALQAIFSGVCERNSIALGAVSGYPSLTFLHEAAQRFKQREEEGKECVILYFGDYDPSGEDIPRSIGENLYKMGATVDVRRFALFESQVRKWKLPPAPTKSTDSRTANWDGIGQVELDAVDSNQLKRMAQDAIDTVFDKDLYEELKEQESTEEDQYRKELKDYVNNL